MRTFFERTKPPHPRTRPSLGSARLAQSDLLSTLIGFSVWPYMIVLCLLPDNALAGTAIPPETALLFALSPLLILHNYHNRHNLVKQQAVYTSFLIGLIFTLLIATTIKLNLTGIIRTISWGLAATLVMTAIKSQESLIRSAYVMLALATVASFLSLYRFGLTVPDWPSILNFLSRNTLAYFLVLGVASSCVIFSTGKNRLACGTLGMLFVIQIFASGSRGAAIALVLSVFFILWKYTRAKSFARGRVLAVMAGLAALALLSLVFVIDDDIRSRMFSIFSTSDRGHSNYYRYSLYAAAWRALPDIFLIGAPLGQENYVLFTNTVHQYNHLLNSAISTDSDYITLLLLGGALPAVCLFGFVATLAISLLRRSPTPETAPQFILGSFLVIGLVVQTTLNDVMTSQFGWFLAGWAIAALRIQRPPLVLHRSSVTDSRRRKMPWDRAPWAQ